MIKLIPAVKKNEALFSEMDAFLAEKEGFHLWWLGQSGFLLQWNGKRVLIDPYLSDSLTKKYANTEKPHIRMSDLVVRPDLLRNISVVTSSHNHTDHLDAETLIPILANNPGIQFIVPEGNREFVVDRVQCEMDFPIGLNDGQSVKVEDFVFHGIPAKHNEIERDSNGNCRFMGYVIKFGDYVIYHSGDTLWFDGMVELLKPFQVNVAILPINGDHPSRKVAGNLSAKESIALGRAIGAQYVIPCHYDMFTFNTADVKDFIVGAKKRNQKYKVLSGGECFLYDDHNDR